MSLSESFSSSEYDSSENGGLNKSKSETSSTELNNEPKQELNQNEEVLYRMNMYITGKYIGLKMKKVEKRVEYEHQLEKNQRRILKTCRTA